MADGETIEADSLDFALKVNDFWYFIYLKVAANIEAIKSIYPQFKDAYFILAEGEQ